MQNWLLAVVSDTLVLDGERTDHRTKLRGRSRGQLEDGQGIVELSFSWRRRRRRCKSLGHLFCTILLHFGVHRTNAT